MTRLGRTVGVVAVLIAALGIVVTPALGSADPSCRWDVRLGKVVCDGDQPGDSPATTTPTGPTTTRGYDLLWRPVLSSGPDGPCIDITYVDLGRAPNDNDHLQSELQFMRFLRAGNSICPDTPLPTDTTPTLEAVRFLEEVDLPVPVPHIQPGTLPVGFDAFLETGAPTTRTFGPKATPFGDLTLTARAEVHVDWDDPHDGVEGEEGPLVVVDEDGPRPARPGPHPDGEITHLYQHHGAYEIRVRYVWIADWRIGDQYAGTIPGAETTGTYPAPGFEVYSRQAVG